MQIETIETVFPSVIQAEIDRVNARIAECFRLPRWLNNAPAEVIEGWLELRRCETDLMRRYVERLYETVEHKLVFKVEDIEFVGW